ncbi:MAG TPA: 50S ribosomal protein L25 [Candidatus Saccharimonadales bacterium]|nr:50S ribosomal protein L25 [Candidatus Saccharimonadales bacterium]
MGDKVVLTVEERSILGKKVKQLRKAGMVPGVMYGHDVAATAFMAPAILATKVWRTAGRHQPVELKLGGKTQLAMIKSADLDPVKHNLRHLSLQVVSQNEKVDTQVPVKVRGEGETPAEKAGLVVLQALESVEIQALPADLPDFLEVDGEKLATEGDHLTVADISPVKGVDIATDPSIVVVSVYEPGALAAQNEAAAGEATGEPEESAEGSDEAAEENTTEAEQAKSK